MRFARVALRIVAAFAVLLAFSSTSSAGSITLAWDPSPNADGYVVLYGRSPGLYTNALTVENQTAVTLHGLTGGQTYYFAVKAFSLWGAISAASNEVSATTTNTAPEVLNPGGQASLEGAVLNLQILATDADKDVLTYSASNLPGDLSIDATTGIISGAISYTASGHYSVTIAVSDGVTVTNVAFSWDVQNVNLPPVVGSLSNRSSPVGGLVSLQVVASDPDGNPLTYIATGLPNGLTINSATGLITGTLAAAGLYSVSVQVSDGALANGASFSWNVLSSNQIPILAAPPNQAGFVDIPASQQLVAADFDGNILTFGAYGLPLGLDLDLSSGLIAGTPTTIGTYNVTVSASDGLATANQSFSWTIAPNAPPVVTNPGTQIVAEGQFVSLQFNAHDPEGQPLTYTSSLPAWLTMYDQGLIAGAPPFGSAGVFPAVIGVSDGVQEVDTAFSWVVMAAPPTPPFVQERYATPQTPQSAVSLAYQSAQKAGDVNVVVVGWRDSTRSVQSVTDSKGNVYTLAVGPTVRAGFGAQSIYYAKNITGTASGENVVTIVFDAPAAFPDLRIAEYSGIDPLSSIDVAASAQGASATSSSGAVATVAVHDVLIAANLVESGTSGTGSGYIPRVITNPNRNVLMDQVVSAAGSYSASTPLSSSGQWIMQLVAFRAAGYPPTLTSRTPAAGPPGAPVTLSGVNFGVTQGTSTVTFNGLAAVPTTWADSSIVVPVPASATSGNIVVTVAGQSAGGVPFVVGFPPTVAPIPDQMNIENDTVSLTVTGSDPLGRSLTYAATGLPSGLAIDPATGKINGTLSYTSAGPHSVTVIVDNGSISVSQSFAWAVTNLNRPPVSAILGNMTTVAGANVALQASASDPDADLLTYTATGLPPGVTIGSGSGLLSGAPSAPSVYNVTIFASDGSSSCSISFVWTVSASSTARVSFIQAHSSSILTGPSSMTVSYPAAQVAGSLNVVVVGWSGPSVQVQSVVDVKGDVYHLAVGPTTRAEVGSQSIYYAPNVGAAAAGANSVTVTFTSPATLAEVRIIEYQGIEPSNVVDVTAAGSGSGSTATSAPATTTFRNDLLFGAVWASSATTLPQAGLTARLTTPSGTLLEDATVTAMGMYTVQASVAPPSPWIIQMVAFRDVNHAPVLNNPGSQLNLSNTVVSLALVASDSDGDTLTFSATGLPPGLSVNSASGVISGTLPWPSAGIYNVTASVFDGLLTTNAGFQWTVTGPTVSASSSILNPGSPTTLSWTAIAAPTATDWVGLYATGAADTAPTVTWFTTGTASGNRVVTLASTLAVGTYQLRLFANGTHQKLAVSAALTVGGATVSGGPATLGVGGTVTATWSGIGSPTATDWIMLVKTGAPDSSYVAWGYTTGTTSGSRDLVVPLSAPAGTYEFRLFARDTWRRLDVGNTGVTNTITILATSLTAGPAVVLPGDTVTATWSNIGAPTAKDWITLVKTGAPDNGWVVWGYTTGTGSGGRGLVLPKSASPGTYELRLYTNDTWKRLAVSNTITVPAVTLNIGPSTVAPGGTLTVSWQNVGQPYAKDWFTLNPVGAADANWVAWTYGSGQANGSIPFTIPANLSAGSYEVRMFSNDTWKRLASSNSVTITPAGVTVGVTPVAPAPGGKLTVSWGNIAAPTATDWLGVYSAGAADADYVTRIYTSGRATDHMLMTLPANVSTGSYELRLFANDSLTRLATSNGFEVTSPGLAVNPGIVPRGGKLTFSWTGIASPTPKDWVALTHVAVGALDANWVVWSYTTGAANGSRDLTIPANTPSGTYELHLFTNDTWQRLAVSNYVYVGPTFSVTPSTVAPGGTLTMTWTGVLSPTSTDWVTLNPLNNNDHQWIVWAYTTGTASGSKTFVIPSGLSAGTYDLRLYANDTWTRLALSNVITVTAPGPSVAVNPVTATSGGAVTASWKNIATPRPTDWIGVYVVGAADNAYITRVFTGGVATGSTPLALPGGFAVGQYELRLFSNDTQTRLAVGNSFTIQ